MGRKRPQKRSDKAQTTGVTASLGPTAKQRQSTGGQQLNRNITQNVDETPSGRGNTNLNQAVTPPPTNDVTFPPAVGRSTTPSAVPNLNQSNTGNETERPKPIVNRNLFNPLSTPERGSVPMKGPTSPPYMDAETSKDKLDTDFEFSKNLGEGSFGTVSTYVSKLDGIAYAIKRVRITNSLASTLKEVYALAVVGNHPHILRYCGSWADGSDILIQTEVCNGGSLQDACDACCENNQIMEEGVLKHVLLHIASGLKFMHSQGIVHLDIAPANIMIQKHHSAKFKRPDPDSASLRDIFEDARILGGYPDGPYSAEECERNNMPIYKLGDLGLASFTTNTTDDDEDISYHRTQEDIWALGQSVRYCACKIPRSMLRDANYTGPQQLEDNFSAPFRELLQRMRDRVPLRRPSAASLVSHELLNPAARHLRMLRRQLEMNQQEYDELCSGF